MDSNTLLVYKLYVQNTIIGLKGFGLILFFKLPSRKNRQSIFVHFLSTITMIFDKKLNVDCRFFS